MPLTAGGTHWDSNCDENEAVSSIIVDLGSSQNVSALTMLPQEDKDVKRGQITDHSEYLSHYNKTWSDTVVYGACESNKGIKLAIFDPKPARYVKLVAKSEVVPRGKDLAMDSLCPASSISMSTPPTPPSPSLARVSEADPRPARGPSGVRTFFASPGGKTFTTTWDPLEKSIVQSVVSNTEHDLFCPGISMDIDGNIIVSGGVDSGRTSIYNGTNWKEGPNMKIRCGYQSSTTLSHGRIFVIGGSWSGGSLRLRRTESLPLSLRRLAILESVSVLQP